jgi:intracellular septation protein A
MKQSLWHLLNDYLSSVLFLLTYAASGNVATAAAIAVAAAATPLARLTLARRRVERLQWIGLAIVLILAAATLLTQSPRFMMAKPSFVHLAVAAAMLRRGWMTGYLTAVARQNVPEGTIVTAGYAWAGLMALLGLTNLIIALEFDFAVWAWFVGVGALGAEFAGLALQYGIFRAIVRRRLAQSVV